MEEIVFKCQTITPMFLSGADGRTPELRAPSIKGAMRFWWRAMQGETNQSELLKKEGELFGSSDENIGKSKFSIRIENPTSNVPIVDSRPLPHSVKKTFEKKAIRQGQIIKFVFKFQNDRIKDEINRVFNITLLLGGFGNRSRRGFGGVNCQDWNFSNHDELINFIAGNLNDQFKKDGWKIKRIQTISANYPYIKEIILGEEKGNVDELLKKIGSASHEHCNEALGYVKENIRMASPIYISIAKFNNNKFLPVITKLNSAFPNNYSINYIKQDDFICALCPSESKGELPQ